MRMADAIMPANRPSHAQGKEGVQPRLAIGQRSEAHSASMITLK